MLVRVVSLPLGQRISSLSTVVRGPRPKWSGAETELA
jgi:hypothetical protein